MEKKGTILLASDHAGFDMKEAMRVYLEAENYTVVDHGPHAFDPDDDYPVYIAKAAREVSKKPDQLKAIIFGGSGQGEAIVANRFPGVRAAVYYGGNVDIIQLSREHNDANVLSIGARFVGMDEVQMIIRTWIQTPFSGDERHARRIEQIDNLPL